MSLKFILYFVEIVLSLKIGLKAIVGIGVLKSLISQFNAEKLGYFHCSIKAPRSQKIIGMFPVQLYFKSTVTIYISFTITAIIGGNA
jgi:hypothetical protein